MPTLQAEQLRAIAAALMRLRGDTLSSVGMATGIRPANLSVWLRGKEQVISAKRVATLMYHLGLEGSSLRADILHQWRDAGALDDLERAETPVSPAKGEVASALRPPLDTLGGAWDGTFVASCAWHPPYNYNLL